MYMTLSNTMNIVYFTGGSECTAYDIVIGFKFFETIQVHNIIIIIHVRLLIICNIHYTHCILIVMHVNFCPSLLHTVTHRQGQI